MCSLSSESRLGNVELRIPQFWSRREKDEWSINCCVAANIVVGNQVSQVQVYPTGLGGEIYSDMNNSESNNNDNDNDLFVSDNESESSMNVAKAKEGLLVQLVNLSASEFELQGEWCVGSCKGKLGPIGLRSLSRVVIMKEVEENIESIKGDEDSMIDNDLRMFFNFVSTNQIKGDGSVAMETQRGIDEVKNKVDDLIPKLSELREQFVCGMESIQDILLETPFSHEVSELREEVSQLKTEVLTKLQATLNSGLQSMRDKLMVHVSTEMNTLNRTNLTALENVTQTQTNAFKQEIINCIRDNSQASSSGGSNFRAINDLQTQLEMLQDSVLTAVSTPPAPALPVYPECPVCFERLAPPAKIYQCTNGHLLCQTCQAKPNIPDCPYCHEGISGRNKGLEIYLLGVGGQ